MKMLSKKHYKIKELLKTLAKSRYAKVFLAFFAFFEALFLPIPADFILIPLALANYKAAFRLALITTIFSVLGGCFGYFIGVYFYEEIGKPILLWLSSENYFAKFSTTYNKYGTIAVFMGGLTPIPYKLVAIFSGATSMPIFDFVWASILSRGLRFFLLATLIYFFHKKSVEIIQRYFTPGIIFVFILILIFYFVLKIL